MSQAFVTASSINQSTSPRYSIPAHRNAALPNGNGRSGLVSTRGYKKDVAHMNMKQQAATSDAESILGSSDDDWTKKKSRKADVIFQMQHAPPRDRKTMSSFDVHPAFAQSTDRADWDSHSVSPSLGMRQLSVSTSPLQMTKDQLKNKIASLQEGQNNNGPSLYPSFGSKSKSSQPFARSIPDPADLLGKLTDATNVEDVYLVACCLEQGKRKRNLFVLPRSDFGLPESSFSLSKFIGTNVYRNGQIDPTLGHSKAEFQVEHFGFVAERRNIFQYYKTLDDDALFQVFREMRFGNNAIGQENGKKLKVSPVFNRANSISFRDGVTFDSSVVSQSVDDLTVHCIGRYNMIVDQNPRQVLSAAFHSDATTLQLSERLNSLQEQYLSATVEVNILQPQFNNAVGPQAKELRSQLEANMKIQLKLPKEIAEADAAYKKHQADFYRVNSIIGLNEAKDIRYVLTKHHKHITALFDEVATISRAYLKYRDDLLATHQQFQYPYQTDSLNEKLFEELENKQRVMDMCAAKQIQLKAFCKNLNTAMNYFGKRTTEWTQVMQECDEAKRNVREQYSVASVDTFGLNPAVTGSWMLG